MSIQKQKTIHVHYIFYTCSFHVFCNSVNNLLSYCGLVTARVSASDKDLPVRLVHVVRDFHPCDVMMKVRYF